MAAWNELVNELEGQVGEPAKSKWLTDKNQEVLNLISEKRGGKNVIFYSSAFLQKPHTPPNLIQITHEEINGLMSVMYRMDWSKGLTLLLHTPGGITNAAETIVAYLMSKFDEFEVIIPAFAMSAGTMISLASNKIIMGRQSQLGPIDPQLPIGGRFISARAIVDQFERAKKEIKEDLKLAHLWAPILQSLGPATLLEAKNALDYGERMVAKWLSTRMFQSRKNSVRLANATAKYFNDAAEHKSHGRRIDRDEARTQNLHIEDLEDDQGLQDYVLSAYHLATITFEKTPVTKMLSSNHAKYWVKSMPFQQGAPVS